MVLSCSNRALFTYANEKPHEYPGEEDYKPVCFVSFLGVFLGDFPSYFVRI